MNWPKGQISKRKNFNRNRRHRLSLKLKRINWRTWGKRRK